MRTTSLSVITPIVPGVPGRTLIDLARALAAGDDARPVVLSIVEVPADKSLSEGVLVARKRREVLQRLGGDEESVDLQFAVRASRGIAEGIRASVTEHDSDLLLLAWRGPLRSEERLRASSIDPLIVDPPCDLAVFKPAPRSSRAPGKSLSANGVDPSEWPPKSVLIPVRGGPHAELAVRVGQRVARHYNARLALMRIGTPVRDAEQEERDLESYDEIVSKVSYEKTDHIEARNDSVEDAIVAEAANHQLVVLGASARGVRTTHLFGYLPEQIADRVLASVMIVKTGEPVSLGMFGVEERSLHSVSTPKQASISAIVDTWFAANTFHSHEFDDLAHLVRLKERQNVTITLALPALNEEATIGKIITTVKSRLVDDVPLLDEMVLIDSSSTDSTAAIARDLGLQVFNHPDILPQYGTFVGKGEALWKSLHVTKGDIIVWIDSDITDLHPKFVYGLLGPLLTQPQIGFVKGYYRRPLNMGTSMLSTGGGRVTELTARPLINLFYPQLSGLVQPLAGEMAGRRTLLESIPFFTGYGVETGLLIDILERHGLNHLAQTDLENRIHRNQDMISLSKMAFAIVQVVMKRLEDRRHIELLEEINTTMKIIHYSPAELFLEVKEIKEHERPPMATIPEYALPRQRPATLPSPALPAE